MSDGLSIVAQLVIAAGAIIFWRDTGHPAFMFTAGSALAFAYAAAWQWIIRRVRK